LDSLVNGLHYFFTAEKGNPCDDLEIGLAQNVLTVDMGTGIGGGITLKTHSYSTGVKTYNAIQREKDPNAYD
jgi:hypothetical protein